MAKRGARKSQTRHHKGGKKNRKWGRMKEWCAAYRASGRRERNKARNLSREVRQQARRALRAARRRWLGRGHTALALTKLEECVMWATKAITG